MLKLYIHIGLGKTGTTAIQTALASNINLLQKENYLYLGSCFEHLKSNNLLPKDPSSYNKFLQSLDENELSQHFHEIFAQCHSYCKKNGIESVIWSWETLANNFKGLSSKIAAATKTFSVRIIVYLRRQDKWVESAYQQWAVKHKLFPGPVPTFDEFLQQIIAWGDLDYYNKIFAWADAFGKENIIVRVYEKEQLQKGLIHDFFGIVGLQFTDDFRKPHRSNTSFNEDVNQIFKVYNSLFDKPNYPEQLIKLLYASLSDKEMKNETSLSILSPQKRIDILIHCEETNRKVATEYLGRAEGQLFYEPWPDPAEEYLKVSNLTGEAVARIFIQIILFQEQRIQQLEQKSNFNNSSSVKNFPLQPSIPHKQMNYKIASQVISRLTPIQQIIHSIIIKVATRPQLNWVYQISGFWKHIFKGK